MRWLGTTNLVLLGLILVSVLFFLFSKQEEIPLAFIPHPEARELPKSPFADTEEFFQEIGEGVVALHWAPPQMQLPDLRQELLYYGKNLRPDALKGRESFHLALKSSGERILIREGERVYLVYHGSYPAKERKKLTPRDSQADSPGEASQSALWGEITTSSSESRRNAHYAFSPDNQATPLWLEVNGVADQALEICVNMLDEKGVLVSSPEQWRCFHCPAQEFPKTQIAGWELDGLRVDSTLLVRQKARWVGTDLFMAIHGGEEYEHVLGKERIDFQHGEHPYCCFVALGDLLIWKENRWVVVDSREETENRPILVVKKIDEKMMGFELWDPEGKGKTVLNLIRLREHQANINVSQELKFVGAKTWAQFIVETPNGVRMTLQLHDWLVYTPEGWKKLDSPEHIDDYVNQTLTGPLFILDKMVKQNGKQVLVGHLFNTARTEVEQVELTSSTGASLVNYYRHMPAAPSIQEVNVEGDVQ